MIEARLHTHDNASLSLGMGGSIKFYVISVVMGFLWWIMKGWVFRDNQVS